MHYTVFYLSRKGILIPAGRYQYS